MAAGALTASGPATAALPPLLDRPPGGAGTERALEEAAASGTLILAGRRLRAFPAAAARRWDLSDTTQADLSRNRFGEVPEAACHLFSLEGLILHHNCLRSVPPAIANLQALSHLDLSRNQLSSLPPCLCLLPLRVLNASNNRLAQLPPNLGALRTLRQLDVGCNRLRALPPGLGQLRALRDLNLRRNQLTALPPELSELPLVRLDFSCNRVVAIPRCFRRLRHLQTLLADNNPLQFPPAQVCLKGKVHIFKYLHLEPEAAAHPPPACPPDELCPLRQRGGLDSGFHSVDSGSKRWSGNESTDEFSELPPQLRESRSRAGGDSDPELVEEEPPPEVTTPKPPPIPKFWGSIPNLGPPKPSFTLQEQQGRTPRGDTPESGRVVPVSRRRPQNLEVWRERERNRDRTPMEPPTPKTRYLPLLPPPPPPPPTASPNQPPAPDERELMAEMRQSLEALLQLRLPEDLGDSELLGRVAARLRPWAVPPKVSGTPPSPPQSPHPIPQPGVPEVKPPTPSAPGLLFALFYGLLMALLVAAHRALFGC
ncbi:LOW QUALITY PROTEIN: leucine-rich repeat and calponin homology domain-containing protein 4-like [Myiozetetes cayanensis]|uniref:LOW QUALITY PROTEIN: leucine-rich repeat and calponin homology domain-containing protein 4-like n=1 Tax=Myiozetetes cayanensis TaxID=478635 RepID=UPI002160BB84|nr:LOW QUALITY PROTEIN: leucine-rich repeat and calponin homology domain-containing protein 4-like [Myiozetetes cayanensis]